LKVQTGGFDLESEEGCSQYQTTDSCLPDCATPTLPACLLQLLTVPARWGIVQLGR